MNFLKLILSPFSIIYWAVTSLRNSFFEMGILKEYNSNIPTISIGNLSMGGTGKTPHVGYIVDLHPTKNVAIISRGYGRKGSLLLEGNTNKHRAIDIGDEPMELLMKFEGANFKMITDGNRKRALRYLENHQKQTELVLLDDAFQHRYVKRNFNILLSDYNKIFYKDYIAPLGTLRESRKGVKRADVIVITKCQATINIQEKFDIKRRISRYTDAPVYFSKIKYKGFANSNSSTINLNKFYLVVSGIANPTSIYNYLSKQNIKFEALSFSDHHNFSSKDIDSIIRKSNDFDGIITTEKDWMRLKETKLQSLITIEIYRLEIGITFIEEEDTKEFNQLITETLNLSK
tara:strand:+ start:170 stop:1207 length:1038 start_codon:yes stop_codon:yes gene_type:complete